MQMEAEEKKKREEEAARKQAAELEEFERLLKGRRKKPRKHREEVVEETFWQKHKKTVLISVSALILSLFMAYLFMTWVILFCFLSFISAMVGWVFKIHYLSVIIPPEVFSVCVACISVVCFCVGEKSFCSTWVDACLLLWIALLWIAQILFTLRFVFLFLFSVSNCNCFGVLKSLKEGWLPMF